ncbi:hypothetical protein K505DRAFT_258575 [Melanomma pulvis-pyrius CBS 109.77]|uniref:RING-type E3 ubiquitin transferase n=1 Tax=Melanomma pulvis-pyrius CBS 109.77 TaxID=1314802 RepID=A0A6A6WSC3_9PLEO|nr:hypothetical protein K505DRAFT_258575 [Melanomma pulvis-pyrius CBS 109.77]
MTRTRAETAAVQLSTVRSQSGPTPASVPSTASSTNMDGAETAQQAEGAAALKHLPSIRFIPHQDPRAGRPSLQFPTITRTLPDEKNIIRVGRYSERDNIPDIPANVPSAAAVGFKSKVVSRKHCELWCQDSQWYIKDVKSSSGTFLNHIRLSQPNVESKPFKLKDGDIIQLGIDFRGGEEMIFRCVKIRIECNRGWQQALNTFNKQTHQRLRNLANRKKEGDSASTHTSECSICLMSIAPCQSLFVAPCSHVWHYKCIRPILNGPTWPNFLCPNCRAVADLEADVEDPGEFEEWDDDAAREEAESKANGEEKQDDRHVTPRSSTIPLNNNTVPDESTNARMDLSFLQTAVSNISLTDSLGGIVSQPIPAPSTPQRYIPPPTSSSVTQPVTINITGTNERSGLSPLYPAAANALSPQGAPEGPMTPRNDAGPFVLDGSAGRASMSRPREEGTLSSGSSTAPTLPPLRMD